MVGLDRLTIEFGATTVLSEVSCTALDGEVVALVGPNGAGKSTLLRAMAGVLEGAAVHGLLDVPQRVSYCPDSTLGFLDLSIAENLELMMLDRKSTRLNSSHYS